MSHILLALIPYALLGQNLSAQLLVLSSFTFTIKILFKYSKNLSGESHLELSLCIPALVQKLT